MWPPFTNINFWTPMHLKAVEISSDFKTQVDNMFKEFNGMIDDVSAKLNNISNAVSELEAKLAFPPGDAKRQ